MSNDRRSTGTINKRRRRLLAGAAGGLTLGTLGLGGVGGAAAADEDTLTIVHDTHFHGRFEDADFENLDIARYQTLVEEIREEYPNAIYLGNGDELAPSVLGLEFEGEHMVEALNETGIDAVGAGNHEFDFGVEVAEERFEESTFPWVIANLLTPDGDPVPGAERWTTVETADHTVGVFGMGTSGFHDITDYPDDWQVLGYEEATQDAVEALTEETDFIVCASHAPSSAHSTIANVDGVDAVVGSHSGVVFDEPDESENAVISEFGDEFDHLGRLTFEVDDATLTDWERLDLYDSEALDEEDYPEETDHYTPVDVQAVDREPELAALADDYLDDLADRLGEPVVESEVELNASFDNYEIETGWGNLMTDAMRQVGDLDEEIDVALQNSGGIRSDATYGPGDITGENVMDILPFPNEIEVYELTGTQLRSYLENAVRPMPGGFGAQPAIQVSGVSYEWTGHDGESHVRNVWVGGEPLDRDETYLVSTNDFVAGRNEEFTEDGLVLQSGQFQGPFVMDYLDANHDTVAPEREYRMIRVDEVVEDAALSADGDSRSVTVSFDALDAVESVHADGFELVAPTHGVVDAESVETDEGVEATLDGDAVLDLFDSAGADELSLLGRFAPDDEFYGYEDDDGEVREMPVNASYDYHKLRVTVAQADVSEALGADDSEETDDDADEAGDDDETDDADDEAGAGDESDPDDGAESDADDTADEVPGFGPAAGAAGVGGAAYLYKKYGADDADDGEN